METIIWFLKDEEENVPVKLCLQQLIRRAETDAIFAQLVELIFQALEFLEKWGILHSTNEFFITPISGNSLYSIRIVKELRNHPPLLEFRVNWRGAGAFRAVFFKYHFKDIQVLVFTQATIKTHTFSQEFEKLIKKSEVQYIAFMKSPEKYIF
ncbi:hypothetical protein ASL14_19270 [Paenibacillus sp. IHB B 3084]|uniref:hypothetical protein n=1 Tax=Paenibacillus sp. IHB B 3084 TaxID=867076 RepID=UPI000721D88B|nr:hypothetical protein [Paenibacillus sp. IHB B 3084]ALP38010.1 hypothetical protein ASL14_19270 [Paenibacillus sp. IHB B 3084]